jgi:hypothetical protein
MPANIAMHQTRCHAYPISVTTSCGLVMASVGPSRCAADSTARFYDQALNIIITGEPALDVCWLIITYTLREAMKAVEQAFLPITEANRKGNLKNGRTYLL